MLRSTTEARMVQKRELWYCCGLGCYWYSGARDIPGPTPSTRSSYPCAVPPDELSLIPPCEVVTTRSLCRGHPYTFQPWTYPP
eukprot:3067544-Rhodomonas_salina.2